MSYPTRRSLPARQKRFSRRIASQGALIFQTDRLTRGSQEKRTLKTKRLTKGNTTQRRLLARRGLLTRESTSQEEVYSQEGASRKRGWRLSKRSGGCFLKTPSAYPCFSRAAFYSEPFPGRLSFRPFHSGPFIPAPFIPPPPFIPDPFIPDPFNPDRCMRRPTLRAVRAFRALQALRAIRAPVRTSPERDDPSSSQPSDPSGHSCCRGNA